jgi:hypothetical protein
MRSHRHRVGMAASVMAVALACAAPPAGAAEGPPAERSAAADAPLGSLTTLTWRLHTPVGARLVLRPHASFHLEKRALRARRAREPRLTGSFRARIVTVPVRGKARTLVTVSRRVRGLAIRPSDARSGMGKRLGLRRWVLSRKKTAVVKRVAARQRLAISIHGRYRVRYTDARGRTVVTPRMSRSITLPVGLKRQRVRGRDLRKLASTLRALLSRVERLDTACVTRNTLVEQLRSTYSTLVAGNRTRAAAMLMIWMRDAEVMGDTGLLRDEQAAMLRSELGSMLQRVGRGRSKRVEHARRWPALPDCGTAGDAALAHSAARAHASGLVTIIVKRVVKRIRKTVRRAAERAFLYDEYFGADPDFCSGVYHCASYAKAKPRGAALQGLLASAWPDDTSEPTVEELVPPNQTEAEAVLDNLKVGVDGFLRWEECCLTTNPVQVGDAWRSIRDQFVYNRWRFQPASGADQQLELLPIFAEYMNLYLAVLREGVVSGPWWGLLPDATLSLEDQIRAELDPANAASAMSYSTRVYEAGLAKAGSSSDPQKHFNLTNEYKRDMQLAVLDFRDMWHLQDPMAHPYGDPGFKQDRIIYSDAIGVTDHAFSVPPNPSSPLSSVTAWTAPRSWAPYHSDKNWLIAVQADHAATGTRTGGSGGTASTYGVAADTTRGPIVRVDAMVDQKNDVWYPQKLAARVQFHFTNGTKAVPGGGYDTGLPCTPPYDMSCSTSWDYDGEVLAALKVMGAYRWSADKDVGDAMVLGFRQADSFESTWKGSLPGSLRAPTRGCLAVEQQSITSGAHPGASTGSRVNGAALEMHDCTGAWEQAWQYEDYDNDKTTVDDIALREMSVYAGTMCAAPKDGATAAGTPVGAYFCDGTSPQKWTRNANGSITHDESQLCLERAGGEVANGTPIRLNACTGSNAQRWIWP